MIFGSSELDFRSLPGRSSADPFRDLGAGDLSMRVVRVAGGSSRRPHLHPHSSEAIYVVAGSGRFWEDGESRRIGPGDCILVMPGVPHATIPDVDSDMTLACFFPHPDLASNIEEIDTELEEDDG
jgi:quercetin dioxygenase-like cupin family protein